jgi:hypothetical protein
MAKFSDRHGYTQSAMQTEGMNDALRNSIWNFISEPMTFTYDGVTWTRLLSVLADEFFKLPIETVPKHDSDLGRKWLRKHYDRLEWYEVYNLLEYTVAWAELFTVGAYTAEKQALHANRTLERELSGYRFLNGCELAPITNKVEIESIEEAISGSEHAGLDGVRTHLETALTLLSQKPKPDYRNSIKESISAVESTAKLVSGVPGGGLDAALEALRKQTTIHPALKQGFVKLYGYTSDADGIRHSLLEAASNAGFDEAKYMLVVCSAFTNYLISKNAGMSQP